MKILKRISGIIVILFVLNLLAGAIALAVQDNKILGPLSAPLKSFALFPVKIISAYNQVAGWPEVYFKTDPDFKSINKLEKDLFALNSFYDVKSEEWKFKLYNLKTDSIIHTWHLNKSVHQNSARVFASVVPKNAVLLDDMSLAVNLSLSVNYLRIDKHSNIIWHNTDRVYHHTTKVGADGNLWVCSNKRIQFPIDNFQHFQISDDYITLLDVDTGAVMYNRSVSQILIDNGYGYIVHGFADDEPQPDIIHLNDVEPVLEDSEYWKKGDVFFSIRHRSLICLFRPSTGKIIRLIQGPFYNQHDVDIFSDGKISFFNNNVSSLPVVNINEIDPSLKNIEQYGKLPKESEILIYNFADSTFTSHSKKAMRAEKIYSKTQGLHQFLSDGKLFVESQNDGKIYLFKNDTTLYKNYANKPNEEGMAERPHWINLYETLNQ